MKKLTALLVACAAMMCAFASCGDKEKETDVSDESSVSQAATDAETESETTADTSAVENATHEYIENADKTAFVGKWESSKLVANGEELDEVNGLPVYSVFQYNILEDGSVTLPDSLMEISDSGNSVTYQWGMISDTEIEITGSNGTSIIYTLQNGQLVNIDDAEEIYLDKVDDFTYFDFKSYYEQLSAQQNEQYILTPIVTDTNGEPAGTGEPIMVE